MEIFLIICGIICLFLITQKWFWLLVFGIGTTGQKNVKSYYRYIAWLYPIGRVLYPAGFCTLQEVGRAMINTVTKGYPKQILEVKDIVELAKT